MQAAKHYVEYDFILNTTTKRVDGLLVKIHSWGGGEENCFFLDEEVIFFLFTNLYFLTVLLPTHISCVIFLSVFLPLNRGK